MTEFNFSILKNGQESFNDLLEIVTCDFHKKTGCFCNKKINIKIFKPIKDTNYDFIINNPNCDFSMECYFNRQKIDVYNLDEFEFGWKNDIFFLKKFVDKNSWSTKIGETFCLINSNNEINYDNFEQILEIKNIDEILIEFIVKKTNRCITPPCYPCLKEFPNKENNNWNEIEIIFLN